MEEKAKLEDPIANDRPMQIGMWEFRAHVEVRPQTRNDTGGPSGDPPLEKGDLWYKMVLDVSSLDSDGEKGMWGELETAWQWSLESAVENASALCAMQFSWVEYDEEKDEYVTKIGSAEFRTLFEQAAARFRLVAPVVS